MTGGRVAVGVLVTVRLLAAQLAVVVEDVAVHNHPGVVGDGDPEDDFPPAPGAYRPERPAEPVQAPEDISAGLWSKWLAGNFSGGKPVP